MPGNSIDGTLRRPILPTQDRGTEIADSRSKLAPNPQLFMVPGAVRPSYKFEDGNGLTDAFGNVYEGYGGAGGSSFNLKNDTDFAKSVVKDSINVFIETPQDKTYKLINNSPRTIDILDLESEFASGSGTVSVSPAPPSGVVGIGGDLTLTISGSVSPEDLTVRIDTQIDLNEI